jgi:hypothetical protein
MCVFKRTWRRKRNDVVRPRSAGHATVVFRGHGAFAHAKCSSTWERLRPAAASTWTSNVRADRASAHSRASISRSRTTRLRTSCHTAVPGPFERVRIRRVRAALCSSRPEGWCTSRCPPHSGITGYKRLAAGIPGKSRAGCARKRSRRSSTPSSVTKIAICRYFTGSDGTRTRDLRRDRPVIALPGLSGDMRGSPREQDFPTLPLRGFGGTGGSFRRPPAG